MIKYDGRLLDRARKLRKEMTPQERKLWYNFLRGYPVKFYKQKIIDGFIVDFYCDSAKLVIELDGSQHYTQQGMAYDSERSAIIEQYGLVVLRFTNTDINLRFSEVCEQIHNTIEARKGLPLGGAVSEAD